MDGFVNVVQTVSRWSLPLLLLGIPLFGYFKGIAVYETFVEGAKEGVQIALRILPYLVAMFMAIEIFRRSGAMSHLINWAAPLISWAGIPQEVLPLALVRPLSGSGALGVLGQLLGEHGPDSLVGLTASTLMGSTETTFYVLTIYLGAIGIKNARHCLTCGLLADLAGFITAAALVKLLFVP